MVLGLGKEVQEIRLAEVPTRSWRSFWSYLAGGLVGALSVGLIFGLVGWLIGGLAFGLLGWLFGGMVGGLVGGVSSLQITEQLRIKPNQGIQRSGRNALRIGLILGLDKEAQEIRLAEVLAWSWRGFWSSLVGGLVGGLLGGLVSGLVGGLVFGLLGGLVFGLVSGLVSWLGNTLVGGLAGGLVGGVSGLQITEQLRIKPNQGIQRSGRNALRMGLVFGLLGGLLGGLVFRLLGWLLGFMLVGWLAAVLVFGLVPVLVGWLVGWLGFGGAAYLQHYLLRWILWRSRVLPWRYVRFLEEATECILLQRVGGGYRFIHPLFLDHFAAQGTEAPPDPVLQSSRQQP
jgi:eukaryotic-like serine/threonine-protein kinase